MLHITAKRPERTVEKIGKMGKSKRMVITQSKMRNIEDKFMKVARSENQRNERAQKRAQRV